MERFKKACKLWFAWNPERAEDYLECMSLQGWHAVHTGGMLTGFLFERGEPRHVRYCFDYQREEKPEYMQIFIDDGWTLLRKSMGWYLWSREFEGARPEIYTDADSLIHRNRNMLSWMLLILLSQIPLVCVNAYNLSHIFYIAPTSFVLLVSVLAFVYGLLVYCVVRLLLSIRKLKKRKA
jgi:hypothetical protein